MKHFLTKYKSKLYPLLAVSDQALLSLVNLLSNIFIIRFSTKSEFGIYGVGFASIVLISGLTHALISLQMTLIAPDKLESERNEYFGSMFIAMVVVVSIFVVLALLGVAISGGTLSSEYRSLVMVIVLSLPGVLTMQFMRQYHYFFNLAHRVLLFDLIYFFTYFCLMSFLVYFEVADIHLWALIANGGIALILGLTALILSVRINIKSSFALAKVSLIEAWRSGSWAVLGSFMTALQSQSYIYLLLFLRGASSVAEMNAARLFLSPLLVMSAGLSRVMIPKMALLKAAGDINQAVKIAIKVMLALIVMLIFYLGIVMFAWDWLSGYMEDKSYENLGLLVAMWGVYFVGSVMVNTPSELLQVFREFRMLTLTGMVASGLVLLGSIPAIIYFGVIGAILILILGEMGMAVLLWSLFQRVRNTYKGSNLAAI
jgi:O-antigen/teichoic acid export membrane protein